MNPAILSYLLSQQVSPQQVKSILFSGLEKMNPAILSYLLSQQVSPQQVKMQAQGPQQAMPMQVQQPQQQEQQMPAQQQEQQMPAQQAPYNPFEVGIKNAINSARESLDMTEKQQHKAMRRAMLSFGNNMAQQPVRKGFWNNFGAIGQAVGSGLGAYDDAEDLATKENNLLANQILGYDAAHRAEQERAEEMKWRRKFAEEQLAEKARHHELMANRPYLQRGMGMGLGMGTPDDNNSLGDGFLPIQTRQEVAAYAKDKKSLGTILQEVDELQNSYNKFRADYQDNVIDPMSPYASVVNPVKDVLGRFGYMEGLRKESADRKTLGSKLNKFVISSERALKGGGVMGPTLIKMFREQGIYPDLDHDTPEIFESKLKMLKEEIENTYKAANLSLNYGVRVDPSQVKEIESRRDRISKDGSISGEQEGNIPPSEMIMMRNNNGDIFQIPAFEMENAIADGLTPYNEE